MRLLFDTNRYADFDRGDAETLRRWELATELWAPFIVLAELRAGFRALARQHDLTLDTRDRHFGLVPGLRLAES
ncbi:MAG: hypothetical protein ACRCT8_00615 [Lacipirellulaceae bacterium]